MRQLMQFLVLIKSLWEKFNHIINERDNERCPTSATNFWQIQQEALQCVFKISAKWTVHTFKKKCVCRRYCIYVAEIFYFNEYLDDPYGLVVFTTFIL